MSWSLVEGPKVVKATKALAKHFADMQPCPADRAMRPAIVNALSKAIEAGKFRTCEWVSAVLDGQEYRVNGKHTSHVISEANGEAKDVRVVVSRFQCDTKEDLAELYSTFDRKTSARTSNDINRIYQQALPELAALPTRVVSTCVTGLAYARWEDMDHGHPAEERAELMLAHPDFVVWFAGLVADAEGKTVIQRGPVAAAMAKTFFKAQAKATEFWELVRDGSGHLHTSVDRKLNKYLLTTSVNTGQGARLGKRKDSRRAVYVKCLHAWNAWRQGGTTDLKYFPNSKTPAAQ